MDSMSYNVFREFRQFHEFRKSADKRKTSAIM